MTDADRSPGAVPVRAPVPARLRQLREQMAARDREALGRAAGDTRRDLVLTALQCVGWVAIGIFLLLWSFHTTSTTWGRIAFLSGIAIGNGGWIFTMLAAYRRGERRGDW